MRYSFFGLLLAISMFFTTNDVKACHAMLIINPGFTYITDASGNNIGISITGTSNNSSFGCTGTYWMDIEVRCDGDPFDGGPFNPGFYGPLTDYPYLQSAIQIKNTQPPTNTPYQPTTLLFTDLCPGQTYVFRVRENHNGNVSQWSGPIAFQTPGTPDPLVGFAAANPLEVCPGDQVNLTADVTGGCGLAATYSWQHNNATTQNTTASPTVPTTYEVIITDPCSNLSITETVFVDILPPPVPGISIVNPALVCEGDFTGLESQGASGGTIQWQVAPNPNGPWTNIAGATSANETSPAVNSDLCFRVEVFGCAQFSYSDTNCVTMSPLPTPSFFLDNSCEQSPADFIDQSTGNIVGHTWDFGDGNGSNNQNPSNIYTSPGTYNVSLEVITSDGCINQITQPITVFPKPVANFAADNECLGDNVNFQDQSTVASGNISNWIWNFNDGNTSNAQNPNHMYNSDGNYNVQLIVITNNGCRDTVEQQVSVFPLPNVNFDFDDLCVDQLGNFIDQSSVSNNNTTNNIVGWNWNFGNGSNSNQQNPEFAYNSSGNFEIILTVTTDNGCSNSDTANITVLDVPIADISAVPNIGMVVLDVEFINNSSGGNTYSWNFANGITSSSNAANNEFMSYLIPGNYLVSIVVDNGICSAEDTALVIVENYPDPEFDLPNIITPDGDGVNDFLEFNFRWMGSIEVNIFNRWGNQVNSIVTSNFDEVGEIQATYGWDGRDRATGQPVTDGVYYYVYEFRALNGQVITGHNFVHVKRGK